MGGWDVNCAFCGASFSNLDAFEEGAYDPMIIAGADLEWLEKVKVIGFNPDSFSVDKCFITGLGEAQDFGEVECLLGDDPNVPQPDRQWAQNNAPDWNHFSVYMTFEPGDTFAAPFHPPCFQVFAQVLKYQRSGKIDGVADISSISKEILWTAMSKLHEEYEHVLSLDYGELEEDAREQYWGCTPGHEAWVSNPFSSPQIAHYMSALSISPTALTHSPQESEAGLSTSCLEGSPFRGLAPELTSEILLHLDYDSLRSFSLSGISPLKLSQIPQFWKRKLFIDLPWLWDFLPSTPNQPRNWFQTYHELRRQCFATTPETEDDDEVDSGKRVVEPRDTTLVLGLANRRRVWNTCAQLANKYIEEQDSRQDIVKGDIGKSAISLQMPQVAFPISKYAQTSRMDILNFWEDCEGQKIFTFYFAGDGDGRLCGIGVNVRTKYTGPHERMVLGRVDDNGIKEDAEILGRIIGIDLNLSGTEEMTKEAKIGITGITLYPYHRAEVKIGQQDGAKRRMAVGKDMAITGFSCELANGIIQRLSLLQASQYPTTIVPKVSTLLKSIWLPSLPPNPLIASPYETGYWSPVHSFEVLPMSYLLFSSNYANCNSAAHLTGLSSDSHFSVLGAHFSDGTSQIIGPSKNNHSVKRKLFEIDGKQGEHIVKVQVGMNALPQAIKFTTSKGRIAFFGKSQKNSATTYEPSFQNGEEGRAIAGIYASWGYPSGGGRDNEVELCTSFSVLSAPVDGERHVEGGHGYWKGEGDEIQGVADQTPFSAEQREDGTSWPDFEAIALVTREELEEAKGRWW
ncbi:hypothetical protein BGZ60DRAFT_16482 [Tricladium varicosporioides]|nr:hypothetical protein BGZ60DRAFT_16482 [Hymenoscyphus varicosporioides]